MGLLNSLDDLQKQLGKKLEPFLPSITRVLLLLITRSLRPPPLHLHSEVRPLGLRRATAILSFFPSYDFSAFLSPLLDALRDPIANLPRESAEQPSPLLQLLVALSANPPFVKYLLHSPAILPSVFDILGAKNVSAAVIGQILTLLENIFAGDQAAALLSPHVTRLLNHFRVLLSHSTTKESRALAKRELAVLSQLAPLATDPAQASKLLQLLMPFLSSSRRIEEERRKSVVEIACNMARLSTDPEALLAPISSQFASFRARESREALTAAFTAYSNAVPSLAPVAPFLVSLNAYSTSRIDEPDFDVRLSAFSKLNEELIGKSWGVLCLGVVLIDCRTMETLSAPPGSVQLFVLSSQRWYVTIQRRTPLRYVTSFIMLADLALRNSASFGVQKVTDRVAVFVRKDYTNLSPEEEKVRL